MLSMCKRAPKGRREERERGCVAWISHRRGEVGSGWEEEEDGWGASKAIIGGLNLHPSHGKWQSLSVGPPATSTDA